MAITDLTGTRWTFKDVLDTEEQNITYSLNFQSNNENFTQLRFYHSSGYPNEMWYLFSTTHKYVYENGWSLPLYKTIDITGGNDATNTDLIAWLQANATLIEGAKGYWKFNWTLDMTTYDQNTWNINFTAPYSGDAFKTLTLTSIRTLGDYPAGTNRLYYISAGLSGYVYSNTDFTYKWANSGARVIFISGGDDVYSDTLRDFLESNATQLFLDNVSDLTNTTWEFYDDLAIPSYTSSTTYNLDFTCNYNGTEITCNKIIVPSNGEQINYYCTSPQEYEGSISGVFSVASGWVAEELRTINITGGSNAATAAAIQFIQVNAKQILTYTTTDKELGSIADAIRSKGGTTESLVYPDGFISAISAISTGGDDPNASIYKDWALNYVNNTIFSFVSSNSSHYSFIYNLSKIGSAAFAQRWFGGDFIFNELTTIPHYAFVYPDIAYTVTHTFSFPKCSYIGGYAFASRRGMQQIYLPVCTSIDAYAFYSAASLSIISAPEVIEIGTGAFQYCSGLQNIEFSKCTSIGNQAFNYCSNLTSISFPNCEIIGYYAFRYCSKLTAASFSKCSSTQHGVFEYCSVLQTANFSILSGVSNSMFNRCSSLTTAIFPEASFIGKNAFSYCSSLIEISASKCVTIDSSAFNSCSRLTSVSFPSCNSIANNAFYYCYGLQSVYLLGSSIVSLGTNVFTYTPITNSTYIGTFGSIYVPSSLLATYKTTTNWAAISSRLVGM